MIFLYVIPFFLHVSKCSDVPTFSHIFRFLHVPIIVFPWFYHVFFKHVPISFYMFPICSYGVPMVFQHVPIQKVVFLWFSHGFPLLLCISQGDADDADGRARRPGRRRRLRIALQLRRGDRPAACGLEGRSIYGKSIIWTGHSITVVAHPT